MRCIALEKASQCASCGHYPSQGDTGIRWKFPRSPWCRCILTSSEATVKGQSRSDSLLLSPYHWAKLFRGGRSDCGCAYEICSDLLNRFRGFCGSNPCISVGFLDDHTSARFKSYQFLKVVSGGRAPGKSSSFASSQFLVIERFHCFRAVRLEKVQFLVSR